MSDRTLTDADIKAICAALVPVLVPVLVPEIEKRLADRFYANAGKGMIGWLVKLWQPILIALILYGLAMAPNLPKTVADAVSAGR